MNSAYVGVLKELAKIFSRGLSEIAVVLDRLEKVELKFETKQAPGSIRPAAAKAVLTKLGGAPGAQKESAGLLSPPQAAKRLGITIGNLYNHISKGNLPGVVRTGRLIEIPQDSVEAYRNKRSVSKLRKAIKKHRNGVSAQA